MKKIRRYISIRTAAFFFSILAFMLMCMNVQAETLRVSPDGMSLTEALESCQDGDTIEMTEGGYGEDRETFPLVISKSITLCGAEGAYPIIDAPPFLSAIRVEADGVTLKNLDIRFRRHGVYAIGDDLLVESCRFALADTAWRTSSCGLYYSGSYRLTARDCAFTDCGICLVGPPLSESSAGLPVLTGMFEVGEDVEYFTTHTFENCTVNEKPLFYAASEESVTVPEGMGEIICCDCKEVIIRNADVSDCSMGMVLVYDENVTIENSRADRCGLFGMYVAKSSDILLDRCSAMETNHGLDVRACQRAVLRDCSALNCDQGLFFSKVQDSTMVNCTVSGTGQGYFVAGGKGNTLLNCRAAECENGFNLQKEGHVLMTGCEIEACTVCGVRLDATPVAFVGNKLKDNWVGVMGYGDVSIDLSENEFDGSISCGLYLKNLAFSRFCGNSFTNTQKDSLQVIGEMSDSIWSGNTLDVPADLAAAENFYIIQ